MTGVRDVVYTYHGTEIPQTQDFDHVLTIEFGGVYDWDSLVAWWSPSKRRFFWLDGSGCSCNSLGDDVRSIDDFTAGNRDELTTAVRAKYDNGYRQFKLTGALDDLAKVKSYRFTPQSAGGSPTTG